MKHILPIVLKEISSVSNNWRRVSSFSSSSSSSSSRSSDGNFSLFDEGGSTSQVNQATVELAGYGSVVWPDSLSEWLVDGAGLQQMFCCLTAITTRVVDEFDCDISFM